MFGWYSKTQASAFGFAIYKSVDGETVQVSEVTEDHRQPPKWDDCEYVGEVIDFVSNFPISGGYEELTELDFVEEKNIIFTDAKHKYAHADWANMFAQQVNVRNLFGVGSLLNDKHPPYYGCD